MQLIFISGASRIRDLPPEQFCRHGFVLAKASEAGFGNEMYKILTAGALSIMLNRSLIIGQTRHIGYLSSLAIYTYNIGRYLFSVTSHIMNKTICQFSFVRLCINAFVLSY